MIDTYSLRRFGKRWLLPWLEVRDLERQLADLEEWNNEIDYRESMKGFEVYRLQREVERLNGLPPSRHWLDLIGPHKPAWETDDFIRALPVPRLFTAEYKGERKRCVGAVEGVSGGWWVYVEGGHLVESCDLSDLQPLTQPWTPEPPEEIRTDCMCWKRWSEPNPFTGEEAYGVKLNRETNPNWTDA